MSLNSLKAENRLLWWWFVGTRGGPTRAKIVMSLRIEPMNAKQLADHLGINYKTVRHHLKVLQDNNLLVSFGDKYGKAYSLSPILEMNYDAFVEVQKAGMNRRIMRGLG